MPQPLKPAFNRSAHRCCSWNGAYSRPPEDRAHTPVRGRVLFRDAARFSPIRPLQPLRLMQGLQRTVDRGRAGTEEFGRSADLYVANNSHTIPSYAERHTHHANLPIMQLCRGGSAGSALSRKFQVVHATAGSFRSTGHACG